MRALATSVILLMAMGTAAAGTDQQFINGPRSAARATLPFSDAARAADTLYISGTIGLDPKTDRAAEDPKAEAALAMDRFKATVEAAGFGMDEVVSVQVYCTDLALYDTFNAVYKTYFPLGFPARSFIGVKDLLRGAHFEVTGIAVRPHN